ncbi:MAG: helix-turn-helix domain-containing protein [Microbacteriaceae bacterium]|nr:helix-turn-helix domain-containing protein [Microbacteriaceae bacterium]
MNLRQFADHHKMTNEALADWLAERCGVSRDGARKWVYGTRVPRPDVIRKIVEATDGQVTADDLLSLSPAPEVAA